MGDVAGPAQVDQTGADRTQANPGSVDEQFRALLEGLRTSLPGVQVLFAFLLTAPLQASFADFSGAEETAFSIAFFASGAASILLISPSVHQRMRAPASGLQRRSKDHLIVATWVTIVGTIVMGVAIIATTFLVSSIVFTTQTASVAAALLSMLLLWAWVYLPLIRFRRPSNDPSE